MRSPLHPMTVPGGLEQLHEPLRYLETQSQKQRHEVARLQRELAQAEQKLRGLDTDCNKTLVYYARQDCLQLATMMYQKLPVEVREMVYEYLCVDPDRPIPVGPYYHFRPYDKPYVYPPPYKTANTHLETAVTEPAVNASRDHAPESCDIPASWGDELHVDPALLERISSLSVDHDMDNTESGNNYTVLPDGRVKEEHTHKAPSDMVLPSSHFLDPRYVGPAVSYEMQKMYYTRNTFSICSVENAIDNFLGRHTGYSMQRWVDGRLPSHPPDLGPLPSFFAVEHIRRLQIRVKFEHFLCELPQKEFFLLDRYAYEQRFLHMTWAYLMGLAHYLDRRPKGAIEIEFVIMSQLPDLRSIIPSDDSEDAKLERDRCFINFLQCIRDAVYKTMYDYEDTLVKVTHFDETISVFPRDITRVFALTKEQWEHEKTRQDLNFNRVADFFVTGQEVDLGSMPGIYDCDMEDMVLERWGMTSPMQNRATHPIREGRFWPVAAWDE